MGSILEDIRVGAEWIGTALRSSGYAADFSASSLWEVDRFIDEHCSGGKPLAAGLLSEDFGKRVFALGSYVGEVIRRQRGGDWEASDSDPDAEINVALRLSDGSMCWPVQRVIKRIEAGSEDGIAAYGIGFGIEVGRPIRVAKAARKKPWWKVW